MITVKDLKEVLKDTPDDATISVYNPTTQTLLGVEQVSHVQNYKNIETCNYTQSEGTYTKAVYEHCLVLSQAHLDGGTHHPDEGAEE